MKIIIPIALLLFLSCKKPAYQTIDFDVFKITTPSSWKKLNNKGVSSSIKGLVTDQKDTLIFNLGMHSVDLTQKNELLVFERAVYEKFSIKKKKQLQKTKHLVINNFTTSKYNPKRFLKYKFEKGIIDCFKVKFIKPNNKGFGVSGIFIDSLQTNNSKQYNRLSFYGNNLSNETEFFKALKSIRFSKYCR